jgi:hypothetical protein
MMLKLPTIISSRIGRAAPAPRPAPVTTGTPEAATVDDNTPADPAPPPSAPPPVIQAEATDKGPIMVIPTNRPQPLAPRDHPVATSHSLEVRAATVIGFNLALMLASKGMITKDEAAQLFANASGNVKSDHNDAQLHHHVANLKHRLLWRLDMNAWEVEQAATAAAKPAGTKAA